MDEEVKKDNWSLYRKILAIILNISLICFIFLPLFSGINGEDEVNVSLMSLVFGLNGVNLTPYALISFIFLILNLISVIYLTFIKNEKVTNIVSLISSSLNIIQFIFFIITCYLGVSYINNIDEIELVNASFIFYMLISFILFALEISNYTKENKTFNVKEMSEIAILVALALVLDKIKIGVGATGGSINISALPLMIIGIRHGFIKGFISSSIIYGLISNLTDGYGLITYPFDYLIAFSCYASSGLFYYLFKKIKKGDLFKNEVTRLITSFILGGVLMFVVRVFGSSLSSIVLYEYNLTDALIYNIPYVGISALSSLVVALLLTPVIKKINDRYLTRHLIKLNEN